MRQYPYCYCGEEDVPGHIHAEGMCIDPDCWVGKTMVGWPHKTSECQENPNDNS